MDWLAMIFGFLGVICVSRGNKKMLVRGLKLYACASTLWIIWALQNGFIPVLLSMCAHLSLEIYGAYKWSKEHDA